MPLRICLLVTAVALLWSAAAQGQEFTSPGPLASAHAKYDQQCEKCHSEGKGASDDKCLECHKVAKTSKYHWNQAQAAKKTCAGCHRDHRGRDFARVRGTPPKTFDHGETGFVLQSAHAIVACKACHTLPQHWMGLKTTCGSCHRDSHQPSLGSKCEACHSEKKFAGADRFDHNTARMKLVGKHKNVACQKCHEATGIKGKFRGIAFAACSDCHREPKAGHAGGKDCKDCHGNDDWAKVSRGSALELHQRTRLPLLGQHAEIACEKCHKPSAGAAKAGGKPGFGPVDAACAACHKDPHERRFGQDCKKCHGFFDFRMLSGAPWNHDSTHYPLVGLHKKVACSSCHAGSGSYAKKYLGRDGDTCLDCHKDPHGGPFKSVAKGDRCETCHTVQGFAPADYGVDQHGQARYPLEGAHRVVACAGCHRPQPKGGDIAPDGSKVAQLRDLPQDCASCHKDVHGGQFRTDAKVRPCESCHTNLAFVPASRFDHNKTRFALVGGHAKPTCQACHLRPAPDQPVQFAGGKQSCQGCHADRHAGQFVSSEPVRNCDDCHRPDATFKIAQFDHSRTRFALDGRHAQVACGKCHPDRPAAEGRAVTFYRIGVTACEQCHRNPHLPRRQP
ncbi:MAG: hypothetical protein HY902_04025 [Deltaproteobacteria bacterium]|nr:hypothetical protein [Deltaproteobacteria bacterium]